MLLLTAVASYDEIAGRGDPNIYDQLFNGVMGLVGMIVIPLAIFLLFFGILGRFIAWYGANPIGGIPGGIFEKYVALPIGEVELKPYQAVVKRLKMICVQHSDCSKTQLGAGLIKVIDKLSKFDDNLPYLLEVSYDVAGVKERVHGIEDDLARLSESLYSRFSTFDFTGYLLYTQQKNVDKVKLFDVVTVQECQNDLVAVEVEVDGLHGEVDRFIRLCTAVPN